MSTTGGPADIYTDGYRAAEDGRPKPVPAAAARPAAPAGWAWSRFRISRTALALTALSCLGLFYLLGVRSQVSELAAELARLRSDLAQYQDLSEVRIGAIELRLESVPRREDGPR